MVDDERIKKLLCSLYKLNFWFCNELIKEESNVKKFEKACKEAVESGEPTVLISGAENNVRCMKSCMEDTVQVINFLLDRKNHEYIEPWQIAGAEAMLAQCSEDNVIPFDLPDVLMAVFGMWDELENNFKNK